MRYLEQEEITGAAAASYPSRQQKRLPQILSEGEVERLFQACAGTSPLDLRDRALFGIAYGCGLRAGELCGLRLGDLDFSARVLRAFGKGEKERAIPFLGEVLERVAAYLREGRPKLVKEETDVLFLTRNGNPLNREDVWRTLGKRGRRAFQGRACNPMSSAQFRLASSARSTRAAFRSCSAFTKHQSATLSAL